MNQHLRTLGIGMLISIGMLLFVALFIGVVLLTEQHPYLIAPILFLTVSYGLGKCIVILDN